MLVHPDVNEMSHVCDLSMIQRLELAGPDLWNKVKGFRTSAGQTLAATLQQANQVLYLRPRALDSPLVAMATRLDWGGYAPGLILAALTPSLYSCLSQASCLTPSSLPRSTLVFRCSGTLTDVSEHRRKHSLLIRRGRRQ